MPKKLTQEEWIAKARAVHGERYGYEKVEYVRSTEKVEIVCRKHGAFWQAANSHAAGAGCPRCGTESAIANGSGPAKRTVMQFVGAAKEVHGNLYDYSLVNAAGAFDSVTLLCPIHGEFVQEVRVHLSGSGCPLCAKEAVKVGKEEFIRRGREKFGDRYDYSRVEYLNQKTKVEIGCPDHGWFRTLPDVHLKFNGGCAKCKSDLHSKRLQKDLFHFLLKAREAHGNTYDYSKVVYVGAADPVEIICKKHGPFLQLPATHYGGHGCPKCRDEANVERTSLPFHKFVEAGSARHANKYAYVESSYVRSSADVEIICPTHGVFVQNGGNHLYNGTGCPKCATGNHTSKLEDEVADFLTSLNLEISRHDRVILKPKELDIVLPSKQVAIEVCGLYYHRTWDMKAAGYHAGKLDAAAEAGLRLITLFEDEWLYRQEAVKTTLSSILSGVAPAVVGARSCQITKTTSEITSPFFAAHHLSGPTSAQQHFILTNPSHGILAAASFSTGRVIFGTRRQDELELVRFCTAPGYSVPGALRRLCSAALKEADCSSLISYVDRRWFTGASYLSAGFVLEKVTSPNYFYIKGQKRYSRYSFAKHTLAKKLNEFDPELTEVENMKRNGYLVIHDCGNLKLRLSK